MSFFAKLTNAGKDVAKKTKELADIAKLNMQISSEEDNIKNKYIEIGKLYYELFSDNPDEKFAGFFSSIAESKNKISDLKDQILEIKGVKKCSNCGAEIDSAATFCSSCGNKVVINENSTTESAAENNGTDENNETNQLSEIDKTNDSTANNESIEKVQNDISSESNEVVDNSDISENEDTSQNVDSTAQLCPSCNNTIETDDAFCPNCGTKLR
jgi:DNA-directed RNA polymerase subunit RPC12/RpoP